MRKPFIIAIGAVAALSIPVIAIQAAGHRGEGHKMGMGMKQSGPTTRADVEARVKSHFGAVDANKDGFIVASEAEDMRVRHRAEMRDAHFTAMDSNKDGAISRAEFDAGHQGTKAEADPGEMRGGHHGRGGKRGGKMGGMMGERMFERADANADGKVSLAEALAKPLARFDAADSNKDGTLTPEERKAARETMRAKWRDRRG